MENMQRNIEQKGRIVYEIYKTKRNKQENNYGEKYNSSFISYKKLLRKEVQINEEY